MNLKKKVITTHTTTHTELENVDLDQEIEPNRTTYLKYKLCYVESRPNVPSEDDDSEKVAIHR